MSGTDAAHREALERLNAEYLRAVERADRRWFEENLAEDFLCSLPDGQVLDRTEFLTALGPGTQDIAVDDVRVRVLGPVALVHAATRFVRHGKTGRGRYTDVWALREGRWVAVAAHVTRV